MCSALEVHVGEVVYLGPDRSAGTKCIERLIYLLNRVTKKIANKIVFTEKNRLLAFQLARFFERRLRQVPCDIIFAPIASAELAFLKTDVPIVFCSDITWPLILDYYPDTVYVSASARTSLSILNPYRSNVRRSALSLLSGQPRAVVRTSVPRRNRRIGSVLGQI